MSGALLQVPSSVIPDPDVAGVGSRSPHFVAKAQVFGLGCGGSGLGSCGSRLHFPGSPRRGQSRCKAWLFPGWAVDPQNFAPEAQYPLLPKGHSFPSSKWAGRGGENCAKELCQVAGSAPVYGVAGVCLIQDLTNVVFNKES